MSRGNRFVIAAFGGLIILMSFGVGLYVSALSYPKPNRYQSYGNAREDKDGSFAPVKGAGAVQKQRPCENPESRDESDLCAQWRASEAAEESALWARVGFFAGLFGLIGLWWQVVLTRRAVEDTSDATEAMREANRLAQISSELEYRPIMIFSHLILEDGAGVNNIHVTPVWKNIGRLPAMPIANDTYRIYVRGRITSEHVAEMLKTNPPSKSAIFNIVPPEAECLGALRAITSHAVGLNDRHSGLSQNMSNKAKHEYTDGIGRFHGENTALFLFRIRYKAALGRSEQEFIAERCYGIMPMFDDTGKMRSDNAFNALVDGYPLETIT
jgi:hypothetical protein